MVPPGYHIFRKRLGDEAIVDSVVQEAGQKEEGSR